MSDIRTVALRRTLDMMRDDVAKQVTDRKKGGDWELIMRYAEYWQWNALFEDRKDEVGELTATCMVAISKRLVWVAEEMKGGMVVITGTAYIEYQNHMERLHKALYQPYSMLKAEQMELF